MWEVACLLRIYGRVLLLRFFLACPLLSTRGCAPARQCICLPTPRRHLAAPRSAHTSPGTSDALSDHHTIPARQCSPSFRFGDRLPFKSPRNDLPGAIEGNRKTAGRNETAVLEQRGLKTRKGPLPQTRRSEPVRNATTARLYNSGGSPGNHAARVFAAVWYVPSQVFSTSVGEIIRPL